MSTQKIPTIHTEVELVQFLNNFEENLKGLREKMSGLYFKQLMEKTIVPEIADLQKEIASHMADPKLTELINTWKEQVHEPLLLRRLTLWANNLLSAKVTHNPDVQSLNRELNSEMVTYQYLVNGEKSDLGTIKDILRNSPDPALRKAAWLGKHAFSEELAPRLIQLIRLRNDLAKEAGFNLYPDMVFTFEGLSLAEVRQMLKDLTRDSNPVYKQILADGQEKLGLTQVEPWDLMYLLETMGGVDNTLFPKDGIEAELQRWGKAHGADLKELGIQMVCVDIPYNGLCVSLGEKDIKILTNPTDGHGSYRTMFHEMGHAFHNAYNQGTGIFRPDAGPFTEGMAELFGYVPRNSEWLMDKGLSTTEATEMQKRLISPWFHYLRERTAYALAEYLIYEDPSCDADAILAQMEHEVLGVTLDHTPRWAANAWYVNYPIYWHNYVLADMVASQIHHELDKRYGRLHGHPAAFTEVVETYLAPGSKIDWQDKLLNHTGSRLTAKALVEDLQLYLK